MRAAPRDPAEAHLDYVRGELLVKFRDNAPDAAFVLATPGQDVYSTVRFDTFLEPAPLGIFRS